MLVNCSWDPSLIIRNELFINGPRLAGDDSHVESLYCPLAGDLPEAAAQFRRFHQVRDGVVERLCIVRRDEKTVNIVFNHFPTTGRVGSVIGNPIEAALI